jgi:hypothetical protein
MEKISWTNSVKNEEILQSPYGKEHPTCNESADYLNGYVFRADCHLKHVNEGKIEGT